MDSFIVKAARLSIMAALIIVYPALSIGGDGVILQGGDTFEDACVINWLPFIDSGTTVGYNLDYENDCGDSLLNGPDVCYSFTPVVDMMLDFSLCGSSLNTQIYIYENYYPNLFACNDDSDSCSTGSTRSFIGDLVLYEDSAYYIVVNGRDGSEGDYVLEVDFGRGQCGYTVGDVNGSQSANGLDVTYGVHYFTGFGPPPHDCDCPCPPHYDFHYKTGDVNGSCSYNGVDITYMVAYFRGTNPALQPCPACPPLGWSPE
ncbi:MAG: hypothetical protein JSU85_00365 [Candidatus Zixiibacteriota bacterium]|nr:MAG: hypothetical protein JSU85_00365 [candidate division Zixibacteria bacterium]